MDEEKKAAHMADEKAKEKAKEAAKKAALAAIEKEAKKMGATVLKPKKDDKKEISGEAWDTLRFVLMTEKCVRMIEADNVLVFIADRKADKHRITSAFEKAFGSAVSSVRTVIDQDGRKKAYIRLKEAGAAGDIAIRLGII
jgi:ribosomal protein L23